MVPPLETWDDPRHVPLESVSLVAKLPVQNGEVTDPTSGSFSTFVSID